MACLRGDLWVGCMYDIWCVVLCVILVCVCFVRRKRVAISRHICWKVGLVLWEVMYGTCIPFKNVGILLYKEKAIQHIKERDHLWCPWRRLSIKRARSLMGYCWVLMEARWGL